MFCFQCQEASKGVGCTIKGVCGKEASTAMYLDLLKFVAKGISIVTTAFRAQGEAVSKEANHWVTTALHRKHLAILRLRALAQTN